MVRAEPSYGSKVTQGKGAPGRGEDFWKISKEVREDALRWDGDYKI